MSADTSISDWNNYWQSRTAGESGAALVGTGIETDAELATFWAGIFAGLPGGTRVLDMACGAGSALRAARAANLSDLTGADVSTDALVALRAALPGVKAAVTPASRTPFDAGTFDMVVSQFGFEYAGWPEAVPEIIRLIAPGGQFAAVAHLAGGAIDMEVRGKIRECEALEATGFIAVATDVFRAVFAAEADPGPASRKAVDAAVKALSTPQQTLSRLAGEQGGLARHLLIGTQTLFERRRTYLLADITGWLAGMAAEITAYHGRMKSMTRAALSGEDAEGVMNLFCVAGFTVETPAKLELAGKKAGWVLRARADSDVQG